jgi:hypothetical protein
MVDLLPVNPRARKVVLIAWTVAAIVGTIAVWRLSTYLDTLTTLAETDRPAALELFRSKALPALIAVVAVAAGSGALLLRQGLQIMRGPGRALGAVLAGAGFLMAAVPLVLISIVFWMLRQA